MEKENLNEDKTFYGQLIKVAVPVLIQQILGIGLNLIDTIMVGKVSENALAAVGAANQVYYIYSVVLFGMFSGAAVYTVQYWGIKDLKSVRKVLGIDYTMCIAFAIPVTMLAFFSAPGLIGLFSDEPEVILLGSDYMRIVCFSYIFAGLTFVITYNSRSLMVLKAPTIVNAIAITINTVLNYGLIYGHLGLPQLGTKGAAIATLIARIIETIMIFTYVYSVKEHPLKAKLNQIFAFSKEMYISVMRTAVPVIITEGLWAVSVSMIFAAYGEIGASALAVVQVASTVNEFFQTTYFGVGNAACVIVGRALGQGNKNLAYKYSRKIMRITWGLNVVMTAVIILVRTPIVRIYNFTPSTTDLLMKSLLVFAVILTPKMLSYMLVCGILRAGGDTVFCMVIEVVFNVFLQVPLAYIAVRWLCLPLYWAIGFVAIADFIKVIFCYKRYLGKNWMNIVTGMEETEETKETEEICELNEI